TSELGKGSAFTIKLPVETSEIHELKESALHGGEKPVPVVEEAHVKANTQLVIDDDPAVRDLLDRQLTKERFTVKTVATGKEVEKGLPALILLDLMMPQMDGFEFLRLFREKGEHQKVPVIVLTAMDLTPEDRQKLNGKVLDILQKGAYRKEDLLREIKELIQ